LDADELDTVTWTDANGDYAFRNLPVVAPVAYGPALLVGDTDVAPDGGGADIVVSETTDSEIVTRSEATFTLQAGTPGDAVLKFDGNDLVSVQSSASLNIAQTLTIEARFKVDEFAGDWMPLIDKGTTSSLARSYVLWINAAGYIQFNSYDSSGGVVVLNTPTQSIAAGQWYDLAVVMDRKSGQAQIYLNGAIVASGAAPRDSTTVANEGPLLFGSSLESFATSFRGEIDDVAIWNEVRSLTQINTDFSGGVKDAAPTLAAHWSFDESSGTIAFDGSVNKNDGLLGGGNKAFEPTRVVEPAGQDLMAEFTLMPEATQDNKTLEDLRQDLNDALAQAQLTQISAEIVDGAIAFVAASDSGITSLTVRSSTHTTVVESTVVDDTTLSHIRSDAVTDGALGFAALTQGVADASGKLIAAAADATTPTGGIAQDAVDGTAVTVTTTTRAVQLLLQVGQLSALVTLSQGTVGDNGNLLDLIADLNAQIGGSALAGKVVADLDGNRVRFTTTSIGSATGLLVLGQSSFSTGAKTVFDDGFELVRNLGSGSVSSALGFDENFTSGTDRSYLVAEVPQVGWFPTAGTLIGTELVLGELPVLFGLPGEIEEGVDFGNLIVVNLDMGPDQT
ncbi:MAG: LamG domain-containing protein, partial [Mycobacterium sp.]